MLPNNFSTSTCFIIFELIKFMCFGSTLIYPHKEFLIPRPSRNSTKYNPLPPRPAANSTAQRCTQKIVRGIVSFSGKWWSFVSGVRTLWRHNLMSYSCLQTNDLAKFVDIICIFFYTPAHPLILCVIALNTNYQRSKLGYRRKTNSVPRHRSS